MQPIHQSLFHIIITSSAKKKFLTRVNQDILFNYITSVLYNKICEPVIINGHSNHIHMLVQVSDDISIRQLVKEIFQNTTDFLRRERSVFPEFQGWDSNYISISYHPKEVEKLTVQIKEQYDLHRKTSFDQELSDLLSF